MKCEICDRDNLDMIFALPLKQENGKLDTMACEECTMESGAYCIEHSCIHAMGFEDRSTACTKCVEEITNAHETQATDITSKLRKELAPDEFAELWDIAESTSLWTKKPESTSILHFFAIKSVRTQKPINTVIDLVLQKGVKEILWK